MDHEPSTLLLVPTELERACLGDGTPGRSSIVTTEICGFGPVAAGARTAQLLSRVRPRRVILIGIAGTYDERRLPVGAAATFDEVVIDGVGVGQGASFRDAAELGFTQWPGSEDTSHESIGARLRLDPLHDDVSAHTRLLVTTCAASASPAEAEARRIVHQGALAEDMEAFSVALACALHGVPVAVVRGISNVAGDRQQEHWEIELAMREAARLLDVALDEHASDNGAHRR